MPAPATPPAEDLALAIIRASRELTRNGMNRGSSGNISARLGTDAPDSMRFLITPSGVAPEAMESGAICQMCLPETLEKGERPSSEWRIHRDIYASRPEIQAIVHTHSPAATALACAHMEVPPFHYMIAVTKRNRLPCAPYALFGTEALSRAVLNTLDGGYACLMANHGMIALGNTLAHAMAIATEVESLCEQYLRVLQTGHVKLLSNEQMQEVHDKFQDYFRH